MKHTCPQCGHVSNPAAEMGRAGGKSGTGKAKARTSEQARSAALKRWAKVKQSKYKHGSSY